MNSKEPFIKRKLHPKKAGVVFLLIISTLLYLAGYFDSIKQEHTKINPVAKNHYRILSFNAAHGRARAYSQLMVSVGRTKNHLLQISKLVKSLNPHFACFQEIDENAYWSGSFNHSQYIAQNAGFPFYYEGSSNQTRKPISLVYGNATLSKEAALKIENFPFEEKFIDSKGFLKTTFKLKEGLLSIFNVHLNFKFESSREEELRILEQEIIKTNHPYIIIGDFNMTDTKNSVLRKFIRRNKLTKPNNDEDIKYSFESIVWNARLDYILGSQKIQFKDLTKLNSPLSDHQPLFTDFRILPDK